MIIVEPFQRNIFDIFLLWLNKSSANLRQNLALSEVTIKFSILTLYVSRTNK